MKKLDYLLACLGEECGEVQQVCGKALRFGIWDSHPLSSISNSDSIMIEIHDVIAVYEMIREELGLPLELGREAIEKKKEKVKKYMEYSRERGILKNDK